MEITAKKAQIIIDRAESVARSLLSIRLEVVELSNIMKGGDVLNSPVFMALPLEQKDDLLTLISIFWSFRDLIEKEQVIYSPVEIWSGKDIVDWVSNGNTIPLLELAQYTINGK